MIEYQSILDTLYELNKKIESIYFFLENKNLSQSEVEMFCIIRSCDFMLQRFNTFKIPEEDKLFYKENE